MSHPSSFGSSVSCVVSALTSTDALSWVGRGGPVETEAVAAVLAAGVDGVYTVTPHGSGSLTLLHLDTVDARVRRAGWHLVYCAAPGALIAVRPGQAPVEQAVGKLRWPAQLHTLPEGPVRSLLADAVWVRALMPCARTKSSGRTFSVLNDDAKTVTRVTLWSSTVSGERRDAAGGSAMAPRIHIAALRGYEHDAKEVARLLRANDCVVRDQRAWFDTVPVSPTRLTPPTPLARRVAMTGEQGAAIAVAVALLGFLDELEANVAGTLEDVDTEFLHDLRVAVRRTRSILKLLGGVLPDGIASRVAPEFRWLGQITTPTRDLDVYLLGVDEMAASITNPNDLVPFATHLRHRRDAVRRDLVRALRSRRFTELRHSWRADLERALTAAASSPEPGPGSAAQLANQRVHRTFRAVRKRAAALSAQSPAEEVHALRKRCKELRYLLEVFAPILDRRAYKQVLGDFKELQKVLGEFQDGEVQAAALRTFAQEMIDQGDASAATLLAMGDLAARFDQRQRHARSELTAHHDEYLGNRAAQHVDRLFSAVIRIGE